MLISKKSFQNSPTFFGGDAVKAVAHRNLSLFHPTRSFISLQHPLLGYQCFLQITISTLIRLARSRIDLEARYYGMRTVGRQTLVPLVLQSLRRATAPRMPHICCPYRPIVGQEGEEALVNCTQLEKEMTERQPPVLVFLRSHDNLD